MVVDGDLQLRRLGQAVGARAAEFGVLVGQLDELLAGLDQLLLAQAAEVLQEELDAGAAAEAAHGRRLHDEDVGVADAPPPVRA